MFERARVVRGRIRSVALAYVLGVVALGAGLSGVAAPGAAQTRRTEAEQRIARDIEYLASDELGGRAAGTEGGRMAARYIAEQLAAVGLEPYGDPDPTAPSKRLYTQSFDFTAGVEAAARSAFVLGFSEGIKRLELGTDFEPLGFSSNGEAAGELVFVGYGISAPAQGWDDYANVDVKGRLVVVLDGLPSGGGEKSPLGHALVRCGQVRYKAMNAREHGARGMIVVAREAAPDGNDPQLVTLSRRASQGDAGIVCVDLRRSIATGFRIVGRDGKPGETIAERQQRIDREGKPASAPIDGVSARVRVELVKEIRKSANVIARLEGRDPTLREEVIVVGAHYDHLGDGSIGGSLADKPGIHHGADDNASGCAAVLELARTLARSNERPRRSVLLIFFSAEELGLLGSAYYVRHPVIALEKTPAMINLDMVGRLRNDALTIGGAGTSKAWKQVIDRAAHGLGFKLTRDEEGFGPSDHSSFYGHKIPVLFLFTGAHEDYHKPSDTADKVNVAGTARIVEFVRRLLEEIDGLAERPTYAKTKGNPHGGKLSGRGPSVYLGTIPDYAATDVEGLRLQGVRDGSPADQAGLRAGDVVVRFDGKQVRDVYDYTYALFAKKPGDRVDIVVLRDGKRLTLHAVMGRKGAHSGGGPHAHGKHPGTSKTPVRH